MKLLSTSDLDIVKILNDVRKGIYIMQCKENSEYFRFGAIGVQRDSNTGIKRLGQCVLIEEGKVITTYEYICMIRYPESFDREQLKSHERILKEILIGKDGTFFSSRKPRVDAFLSKDTDQVRKLFLDFYKSTVAP